MKKVHSKTEFEKSTLKGPNGKLFALLNKRTETNEETEEVSYVADAYDITDTKTMEDVRKTLYREAADPLYFQAQRDEATNDEWLAAVQEIKDFSL